MKLRNPLKCLGKFDYILWGVSVFSILCSFLLVSERDYLTLCASLIGVSALIFVAKGHIFGQILVVIFAIFYGIISFFFSYYGEMITYLLMSAPMAVCAIISWAKNPYGNTSQVKVHTPSRRQIIIMLSLSVLVTIAFYFILGALGTASLIVSTVSVLTSFIASYLTFMRSPYYAIAYALNDIILIVLWVLASIKDISQAPMVACFVMFFLNDLYGFICWKRMQRAQASK